MRVVETVAIERDIEDVWRFVSDPSNDPAWCPKVKAIKQTGDGRWGVIHRPVPVRPPTELVLEHLAVRQPHRLTLRQEDAAAIFEVEYRLEPMSARGTRFTQISDFRWKSLSPVLQPVFAYGVRRDVRRQLRELKNVLERAHEQ